jgi:hypothetical protein
MSDRDPFDTLENRDLQHLQSFIYLIPVLGAIPALWTLSRGKGTREQRSASRTSLTLAFGWALGYILLAAGAHSGDGSPLPFLLLSSVLTSSYFIASVWLMMRVWQRKPLNLPGMPQESDRPIRKMRWR